MKKFISYFSLSSDVLWIFASKFALIAKGPLTALFIVLLLSPQDQGLWYTFISLSALAALAELGFTLLISQLVSHEFEKLSLRSGFVRGKKALRDKLFSLIRFSVKLYFLIVPLAATILLIAGLYVLNDESSEVKIAWILFAMISAISLLLSLFQSIYQGLDKISDVYRIRTIGNLLIPIFSIIFMYLGCSIWALIISSFISIIAMSYLLFKNTYRFWAQILRNKTKKNFTWFKEVLPLQGKYAVSWASGYAIFNLIIPVTFKIFGAEEAGKLGLLISLSTGITYLSNSWLEAVIPKMNFLVAKKNKLDLDALFKSAIIRGYIVFFFGCCILLSSIYTLNIYDLYSSRILTLDLVALFLLVELSIITIGFLAKYLRAHRAEPFYLLSLLNGALMVLIILLILPMGFKLTFTYMLIVYWFILTPIAVYIYNRFVKEFYNL